MITIPNLKTALLDLLREVEGTGIKLIIGGGFGIYLKTDHAMRTGARTLFGEWPDVRSTNDLDLFLRPELLIDSAKLKPLAVAISKLGYQVVPGAGKYQFVKPGPEGDQAGSLKIDILTGPQSRFKGTKVRADARRARPNPSVGIHAHPVDEAPTLEKGLLPIKLEGKLGSGDPWEGKVFLPHPYTFISALRYTKLCAPAFPLDPAICRARYPGKDYPSRDLRLSGERRGVQAPVFVIP